MKTCSYCGRENKEALVACQECGTELNPVEPAHPSPVFTRRNLVIIGLFLLVIICVAAVSRPMLIVAIPLLAIFYLPIYLPFVLSFCIRTYEWRGMRWSLRIGSVAALLIPLVGVSSRPDFGNDVGGNIAGASHNFAWTWGSGAVCAVVAVVAGLLLHAVQARRT